MQKSQRCLKTTVVQKSESGQRASCNPLTSGGQPSPYLCRCSSISRTARIIPVSLEPRQDVVDLGDEVGGPRINAVARAGDADHERLNATML